MQEHEIRKSMREAGSVIFDCLGLLIAKVVRQADVRPLSTKEAAKLLGYSSEKYFREKCARGEIPGAFKEGDRWFVDPNATSS